MGDLKVISYKGERVLTTSQLAEAYGTESKRIQNNFNENRALFSEGKHCTLLAGQDEPIGTEACAGKCSRQVIVV
ncbi:ORF6N domain-containing protein [Brevibacillus reuszeri]|uniref:ORF6N domain-containing protein n=1 Tax=Brevibacillus reuszeri TaxID=54915 RepID=UPI003D1967A2